MLKRGGCRRARPSPRALLSAGHSWSWWVVPREYPVSTPCRPAERAAHLSTVAEMLDDPDENVRWEVPREYSVSTPGVLCEYPKAPCERYAL